MSIKMIAADMDGTLLDPSGELTERTVKAVRRAMDAGIYFVLSSGRMPKALARFDGILHLNAPVVAYNGGLVTDLKTGEEYFKTPLPIDTARAICREAERRNLYLHAFTQGSYIAPEYNEKTAAYEKLCGVKARVTNRPLSECLTEAPMKLLIIDTARGVDECIEEMRASFKGRAVIMRSQPHFMECVDADTSKARALNALCARLSVARKEVAAFGDGQNDLEMLLWAGVSYVMDNAPDAVKHASDRFLSAPGNREDGVARVIEETFI